MNSKKLTPCCILPIWFAAFSHAFCLYSQVDEWQEANSRQITTSVDKLHVSAEIELPASARSVWETISDFNGWHKKFLSDVSQSRMTGQGLGAIRILKVIGVPDPVMEQMESIDHKAMSLGYKILDSPLPIDQYHGVISLNPLGCNSCKVLWSCEFLPKGSTPPADAEKVVKGLYIAGLNNLKTLYTPKVTIQKVIASPAEAVWRLISDFNAWNKFLPPVTASRLVSSGPTTLRILTIAGSDIPIIERLDSLDPENKSLTYSIVSGPAQPFENYVSKITVQAQGQSSLVTWSASYFPIGAPSEAEKFVIELYTSSLEKLSQIKLQ